MINLVTIDCDDSANDSVANSDGGNSVTVLFRPPASWTATAFTVRETGPRSGSHESGTLSLNDSGMVVFELPFEWYSSAETMALLLASDDGEVGGRSFLVQEDLAEGDDVKVEIIESGFRIRKIESGGGGGSTVSVRVGSTTTLEPGSFASVTNSGDEENVVLNFGIPRGATGATGATGPQGPQGERGEQGERGIQGERGEAATVTGYDTYYAQSSSATDIPTDWSETPPTGTAGYYLWSRNRISFSDGTTVTGYSRARNGSTGTAGYYRWIQPSCGTVHRSAGGTLAPSSITFYSYYRTGSTTARSTQSRYWLLQYSTNGSTWTQLSTGESSASWTPSLSSLPAGVKFLKACTRTTSSATTYESEVTVPIVDDASISATDVLSLVYPIGSVYMSVNSTSPASFLGGTWERIQGKFLLAAGTGTDSGGSSSTFGAGSTGGEYDHKLTAAESGVPAHGHGNDFSIASGGVHRHLLAWNGDGIVSNDSSLAPLRQMGAWSGRNHSDLPYSTRGTTQDANIWRSGADDGHAHTINGSVSNNTAAAASSAHNNMPPYLAVYMWKRTA